jgi:hypothetical protein
MINIISEDSLHNSDSLNRSDNSFFSMSSSPKNSCDQSNNGNNNTNINNSLSAITNNNNNVMGYSTQSISSALSDGGSPSKPVPVVWQVDFKELMLQEEIGSGAYGKV